MSSEPARCFQCGEKIRQSPPEGEKAMCIACGYADFELTLAELRLADRAQDSRGEWMN